MTLANTLIYIVAVNRAPNCLSMTMDLFKINLDTIKQLIVKYFSMQLFVLVTKLTFGFAVVLQVRPPTW